MRNPIQQLLSAAALAAASLVVTVPVLAATGGAPQPSTPPSSTQPRDPESAQMSAREEAERFYADAYGDIEKAKKDLAKGNEKNALKKFKRALERSQRALELDKEYFEAWNLLGYSQRKLGDLGQALTAYGTCLKLNPRYVPAREYLGEAYVELGKIDLAKEQLAMLKKLEAEAEAKELEAMIDAWVAGNGKKTETDPTSEGEEKPKAQEGGD